MHWEWPARSAASWGKRGWPQMRHGDGRRSLTRPRWGIVGSTLLSYGRSRTEGRFALEAEAAIFARVDEGNPPIAEILERYR